MSIDLDAMKQGQRAMWAMGDYPAIATRIESVAAGLVRAAGVATSQTVLDVATGSGNVALEAAQLGAQVTGLDLTPELLQTARRRAAEANLEIDWLEGDAEQLPFPDGSFERVLSCFGTMFAPRHEQAAAELLRTCRPGGTIGVCAWTPEGVNGQMFALMGSFMPSPPEGFQPPVLWGNEDHMRKLLERDGVELSFERHAVDFEYESTAGWITYGEQNLGPAMMAKRALEPQGRYEELREQLSELYERNNEGTDGSLRFGAEYLLTLAHLPA